MYKWIIIFIFLMFQCGFVSAQTTDSEKSQQNLQQQIERLVSVTDQNDRDISDMSQTLNYLRKRVDEMDKEIDDLRRKHQELARRLGR